MAHNVERSRVAGPLDNLGSDLIHNLRQHTFEAIDFHRALLALRPPGHPYRFMSLNNLAVALAARFERQAAPVVSDLDEAIELFRAALAIFPIGHPDRSASLDHLAIALQRRFWERGVLSDIVEAINCHRAVLVLRPPGHLHRFMTLNNLAVSLTQRFKRQPVLSDLDEAIELFRAALSIFPAGHSGRYDALYRYAGAILNRFSQRGVLSDLDEAIYVYRAVLAFRHPGQHHRFKTLEHLAESLAARFVRKAVPSDLDEAIELFRVVVDISPPRSIGRSRYLLAGVIQIRYCVRFVLADIVEVINHHRAVLALYPPGHHDRFTSLNSLADGLLARFARQTSLSDLDEAIDLYRAALAILPLVHPGRCKSLYYLAVALQHRFERWHAQPDLDEIINLYRAALGICLPGDILRPRISNRLALNLVHKFRRGAILDEAVGLSRAALTLCPPGHSDRLSALRCLTFIHLARLLERGVLSDLDDAINLGREGVALCPPSHPLRLACLSNLAVSLADRFDRRSIQSDLDEAIELRREVLVLCLPGNCERYQHLFYLADSLFGRFRQRGIQSDIDEAIDHYRASVELCPPGHPARYNYLRHLACSLKTRCQQRDVWSDLDEVIELHRGALELLPPGHLDRSFSLHDLARSLQYRFKQRGLSSDLDEAFGLYSQLSQLSHPVSRGDIYAAEFWIVSAEEAKHGSAVVAYQTMLKFLDQHITILASSSDHFDAVKRSISSRLPMDAFSCCVRRGALTTAVELVEQGRAVLWTQLLRFRSPLDELSASSATGNALAKDLKKLTVAGTYTQHQPAQFLQLATQWNNVVSRIRQLPGFSRFLLPPLFSDLQKAAKDGPVIIVNASKHSCDALIIARTQGPVLVPLGITLAEVSELSTEFRSLTERLRSSDHRLESNKMVDILRKLWTRVVGPVVEVLKDFIDPGSRIWWCPTAEFTLLPLHAAGPYEKKRHNLSHFYVSSYTPTLAALIRARQCVSQDASRQRFVAVGQGNQDGGKELGCVDDELNTVAQRVAPVLSFTLLADDDATVQRAFDAFSRNQWFHLACLGTTNQKKPFESSFAMRDGPFTIKDILRSRVHNPEFAFLSACHTTVNDESSPEAIHLAAAMQFSGFRSVIGSMWSVDDEVTRQVVAAFYDNLVSGRLDCRRAAVALHDAVKSLGRKIPLEQQIAFVHIGV